MAGCASFPAKEFPIYPSPEPLKEVTGSYSLHVAIGGSTSYQRRIETLIHATLAAALPNLKRAPDGGASEVGHSLFLTLSERTSGGDIAEVGCAVTVGI